MAQITYRGNLSAKAFPFLSENWGRSVIVPQYDNNFNRRLTSSTDEDADIGIPQIYYCHNVMPHQQGFQSIGYRQIASAGVGVSFTKIFKVRDSANNSTWLGFTTAGAIYRLDSGSWTYVQTLLVGDITTAFVGGVTYICVRYTGLAVNYADVFTYNFSTGFLASVTLAGLDPVSLAGITYSAGYLIAWNATSPSFTCSATTTAGSTVVSITLPTGMYIVPGALVTGTGIASGTTAVRDTRGEETIGHGILLSAPATASGSTVLTLGAVPASISWSSTIDPTDFVPSLTTGAGGGSIEAAKGTIVTIAPHLQGFIAYTTDNCVVGLYTGNSRYPFNFREIVASGGLKDASWINFDPSSGNHWAYTTSGMQLISTTQTQTVLTDLTDFISGRRFEDYDEVTDTMSDVSYLSSPFQKSVALVADRYLIVSYGVSSLTHALVHDITSKRWGKLKIPHVQCFEYSENSAQVEPPKQSICFLQADGTIKAVDFNPTFSGSNGVILLGKYQFVRQRLMQLNEINIENVHQAGLVVKVFSALDGKNTTSSTPYLAESTGLYRRYLCRAAGINHTLMLRGAFFLDSLVLNFSQGAKR